MNTKFGLHFTALMASTLIPLVYICEWLVSLLALCGETVSQESSCAGVELLQEAGKRT